LQVHIYRENVAESQRGGNLIQINETILRILKAISFKDVIHYFSAGDSLNSLNSSRKRRYPTEHSYSSGSTMPRLDNEVRHSWHHLRITVLDVTSQAKSFFRPNPLRETKL
jgi:hypothetical protein